MKFWAGDKFDYAILPSAALPAGTLIAIEPTSLAATLTDAMPDFATSDAVVLHYEDASPQDITGGSPSPASPVRNLFQTDGIALRLILSGVSWAMRAPHVAVIENASW